MTTPRTHVITLAVAPGIVPASANAEPTQTGPSMRRSRGLDLSTFPTDPPDLPAPPPAPPGHSNHQKEDLRIALDLAVRTVTAPDVRVGEDFVGMAIAVAHRYLEFLECDHP